MAAWIAKRDGYYTVRWSFRGRQGRRKVPTRRIGQILVKEIEACHALGIHWVQSGGKNTRDPCISDLIVDRLERGRRSRKHNTIENWKFAYILFVKFLKTKKPRGRLGLELFTESNIYGFYDWLINTRGNKQLVATSRVWQINGLWKWAAESVEWGDSVPRFVRVETQTPPAPPIRRSPTWSEVDLMIQAMRERRGAQQPALYKAVVLMRYLGIRMSQALSIRWEAFNLDDPSVEISGELGKSRNERRGRVIPIASALASEMATWGRREGLVSTVDGKPVPTITLSTAVNRCWKLSGVDKSVWSEQSCHALRRSFTSELVSRGADRFAVELLLGRTTGVGGDVYTDPRFIWSRMAEAVELVTPIGDSSSESLDRFKSNKN